MTQAAIDPSATWRPTLRLGPALALLAVFMAVTTMQGLASQAAFEAHGLHRAISGVLASQYTGAFTAWLALPVVQHGVARAGLPGRGWWRFGLTHVAGYVVFALVHAIAMITLRTLVDWVCGTDMFSELAPQVAFELRADLILYPALAGLWYAMRVTEERRLSALRAEKLERALAESRLDALSARLDPHFLFNTLHTIGAVMHEDLSRTETLLANLGDLLRVTLEPGRAEWTVEEERAHTERYVDILRARFADRLVVSWSTDDDASARTIPRFAIQTLVENAVKHNERESPLHVVIEIRVRGDAMHVVVSDDGRGFGADSARSGRGLARLEESLVLIHGERASIDRGPSESGGARVVLHVPEKLS